MRPLPSSHPVPSLVAAALLLWALPTAAAQSSGFPEGELYLYGNGVQAPGHLGAGVWRVDPVSGASSVLAAIQFPLDQTSSLVFDPHRQLLVFTAAIAPSPVRHLWSLDANGQLENLSLGFAPGGIELNTFAPTGDGRIYCRNGGGGGIAPLRYLDAAGQLQVLYDADGTTPMAVDGSVFYAIDSLIYDPGTNALFVASIKPAPGFPDGAVNVRKLPLSADGSRVVGPIGNATFEVSSSPPGATSNETPRGFSRGPNGKLALCILCIDQPVLPRMLLVDPVTLQITPYGSNGSAIPGGSWATTTAGVFTPALDEFVVVNTSYGQLHRYAQGGSSVGSLLSTSPAHLQAGTFYYLSMTVVPDDGCDGAGSEYGAGSAGSGGIVPRLSSAGCPDVGQSFALEVERALGGSLGLLLLGSGPTSLPLYGGQLLVVPSGTSLSFALGGPLGAPGAGSFTLPLLFSSPALSGQSLYLQAGCFDPAASGLISLTNGLQLTIG
jgi:hypothetical protein